MDVLSVRGMTQVMKACGGGVALKTTGSTKVVWIRDPGGQHRLFNIFKWLCYKGNIRVYDLIR